MHTIGDPRGGTIRQRSGTVHQSNGTLRQRSGTVRGRSHWWSVRCQTRTQIISPSQSVSIKLRAKKVRCATRTCNSFLVLNPSPSQNVGFLLCLNKDLCKTFCRTLRTNLKANWLVTFCVIAIVNEFHCLLIVVREGVQKKLLF